MKQSRTHRVALITAAVMLHTSLPGSVAFAAPAVAATPAVATTSGTNEVREVRVEKDGAGRVVHIVTDREPAFTVFRLNDPMRLVIDIARGSVAQIDAPIDVNDGVVSEIAKAQFADGKNLLGRLVVGFERTVDYEVKGVANGIRLVVRDTSATPPVVSRYSETPVAAPVAAPVTQPAGKAVVASVTPPQAQAPQATAQIAPPNGTEKDVNERPSQVPIDKTLTKVKAHSRGKSAEVALTIVGGTPAYEILELEDPPRVVVDLIGVRANAKTLRPNHFELGELGRLRLGAHADKVRIVFDAPRGIPEYDVVETKTGLKFVAAAKTAAPAVETVAANVQPMKSEPAKLETAIATAAKSEPVKLEVAAVPAPVVAPSPAPVAVVEPAPTVAAAPKAIKIANATTIVAEAPKPEPVPVVAAAPKAVLIQNAPVVVAEAPKPAPIVVAAKSAKEVPVVVIENEAPQKPVRTTVDRIDFAKEEQLARVAIVAPESVTFEVDERLARAPVLRLTGASLVKKLERSIDVSREKTNVLRLTSFNERSRQKTISVIANLRVPTATKAYRQGDLIVWEIASEAVKPAPVVVAVAEPVAAPADDSATVVRRAPDVAGFSAQAVQLAKTAAPAADGKRITIDLRGTDLLNVLRLISEVSGENIIAGDDVTGKITLRLRNVPWEQALDATLQAKGYGKTRQQGIIRVAPLEKLQKEREAELARLKTEEQVAPTYVRLIPVNYAKAASIMLQVAPLLTKERGKVQVDERTNTIIAEDLMAVLNKIETLIHRLDTQTPQVLIESRIVEANTSFVREIGIQWGGAAIASAATGNPTGLGFPSTLGIAGGADGANPASANNSGTFLPPNFAINLPAAAGPGAGGALGLIFGNAANTAQLALRLSALENNGQVRIVSAPKVATLDNAKARIAQGVSIPISVVSAAGTNTRFVDANLELEVTPHVTQDGSVMMEIKASKNEPNFARTGAQGDPTIEKKTAETQVLVKDGETTVIGGIYTRNSSQVYSELPWLGKIPVLGWLFKKKREEDSRAELLVFITPRIVNRQQMSMSANGNGGL